MSDLLRDRVKARLDTLNINPFEAARRAGFERGYVNDLLIGKKISMREKSLAKLADALECDPGYLLGRQAVPSRQIGSCGIPLAGIAEANAWRRADDPGVPDTPIPISPDPRFDPERIQLYLIRGDHAGGIGATDGSVIAVLTNAGPYRDGDVVLVERLRDDERELSIRVISGGALSARPLRNSIPAIPLSDARIIGMVVSATRIFGLPA